MSESNKEIEIDIDWDTGKIVAHVEGFSNKVECKREIMELIDGMVDIVEGGWTIDIRGKGDPNAKQKRKWFGKRKGKGTN